MAKESFPEFYASVQEALGARLRTLREEQGLRQTDFQDFSPASIDAVHYRSLESGRRNATLKTLLKACWKLGISPRDLFPDRRPQKGAPD